MCDSLDFIRSATQISLDERVETKIVIQMNCDDKSSNLLKEFVQERKFNLEKRTNNLLVIY
jgi:hypothetical protein